MYVSLLTYEDFVQKSVLTAIIDLNSWIFNAFFLFSKLQTFNS